MRLVRPKSTALHRSSRGLVLLFLGVSVLVTLAQTGCADFEPQPEMQSAGEFVLPASATAPPYGVSAQPAPLSSKELDQLVAPIALYPDALVAQVLASATYPTEIVEADRWRQQNSSLKGDALAKAVDQQPWDPSVKALVQFPGVLEMMDKNLAWTSSLGQAYGDHQTTVLQAIQHMRSRAQQAGNLDSTPEENVTTLGQTIVIEPANPQVVYVPEYDPWLVYGAPVALYPDWVRVPGAFVADPGVFFGAAIGIGAFAGFGWGWDHWNADWHHHFVDFDHHRFVSYSPTFGHFRPVGGPGTFGRPAGYSHAAGFQPGGFVHSGRFPTGGFGRLVQSSAAMHPSAFSGFDHGGIAGMHAFRGGASLSGSRATFGGGFHGGGSHGGGHR